MERMTPLRDWLSGWQSNALLGVGRAFRGLILYVLFQRLARR